MPSVRVTQEVSEVVAEPDFQEARVTQEVLEVPLEASSQNARVTQVVLEVLIGPALPGAGPSVWPRFF